ncbi:histone deacetylase [Malassezia cuniculi]|uniref:histone deacetylase n=1 Tax=Malassezia cuniculi TaxID=948313 RepID=A0AAF0EW09_9BASI|nr:histone deacetylase [Malassezia cuniculi]
MRPQAADGDTSNALAAHKSGIVFDSRMMLHATPADDGHPERPERIARIFDLLQQNGYVARMTRIPSRAAFLEEAKLVHDEKMWHDFETFVRMPTEQLRPFSAHLEVSSSLYLNNNSMISARLSLGSVIELSDAVASRRIRNGFAVVRPPGHHAEPDRGMGFCMFNNVAVAARWLQQKYTDGPNKVKRIMILDWDVHHGNGTQRAFWDDADILYVSLHRYEGGKFYPGGTFGNYDSVGGPSAMGKSINIPWPCGGMNDGDYLHAFNQVVIPAAHEFAPDFVFISAGFDAADGDILGGCKVSPTGYAHMTYQLAALAGGRLAVVLEGGYTLDAIANSALAVTKVIVGETPPPLPAGMATSSVGSHTAALTASALAPYWRCFAAAVPPPAPSGMTSRPLEGLLHTARKTEDMVPLPVKNKLHPDAVLATPNIMLEGSALVILCHDLPALHFHTKPSAPDGTEAILNWVKNSSYALIDIEGESPLSLHPFRNNMHERIESEHMAEERNNLREVLLYVWDNYAALALAPVVLIGYGHACDAVMHLIANRSIKSRVRAMVQVLGHNALPLLPKNRPELRSWFKENARVLCPKGHPVFADGDQSNSGKRLGNPAESSERDPALIFQSHIDQLEKFIQSRLT